MKIIRSKELSFYKKRKRITLTGTKSTLLLIGEIIIVLFMAFVIVYCAGMQVTVMGNSMEKTLKEGNTVFVNRFTYNLFSPKAGDVVVFLPNGNEKSSFYIKRVVGTPGDKVQIRDGILYVNGELFDDTDVEAMKNAGIAENEITIGEDEFFVLGDNRNSSEDSRYTNIGNVKKDFIIGKVWFYFDTFQNMGRVK